MSEILGERGSRKQQSGIGTGGIPVPETDEAVGMERTEAEVEAVGIEHLVPADVLERYWRCVDKGAPNGCWQWRGASAPNGYGAFTWYGYLRIRPSGTSVLRAHRFAYELRHGFIADRRVLACHRCDNRRCVNPDHIFLGSARDNALDATAKGRVPRGAQSRRSKLTEAEVEEIRALALVGVRRGALGALYGISERTVPNILDGSTWRHVTGRPPLAALVRAYVRATASKITLAELVETARACGIEVSSWAA